MTIYYAIRKGRKVGVFRYGRYAQLLTQNFAGCQMRTFDNYLPALAYVYSRRFYVVYRGRKTGVFNSPLTVLRLTLGYPNALVKTYSDAEFAYQAYQAAFRNRVFYAVRKGKTTGIYTDFKLAQKQVNGFQNNEMKKFKHLLDAKKYLLRIGNNPFNLKAHYRLRHTQVKIIGTIAPLDLTVLKQDNLKAITKNLAKSTAKKPIYYAVKVGRQTGVYTDRQLALKQVSGYSNYQMKKFKNYSEAEKYLNSKKLVFKKAKYYAVRNTNAGSRIFLDNQQAINYARQCHGALITFDNLQEATKFISIYNNQFTSDPEINLTVYTDGGFANDTKCGSWAYLIKGDSFSQSNNGAITCGQDNNQMELMAVKEALLALKAQGLQKEHLQFMLDSQVAISNICAFAIKKEPVIKTNSLALICEIDELLHAFPHIYFSWVKGHATSTGNCFVDRKASEALLQINQESTHTALI